MITSPQFQHASIGSRSGFGSGLRFCCFVFKTLNDRAPSSLKDLLAPRSSSGSPDGFLLCVPRSSLKTKGGGALSVAAPRLWNPSPPGIRLTRKAYLFSQASESNFYYCLFLFGFILVFLCSALWSALCTLVSCAHVSVPLPQILHTS